MRVFKISLAQSLALFFSGLCISSIALTSEAASNRWLNSETLFYTDNLNGADDLWKDAFEEAAKRWNDTATSFWIGTRRESGTGFCTSSGTNSVGFRSTVCGDEWGENTLAVTSSYASGGFFWKTDIIFNNTKDWTVYDGIWRFYASDFQRVAIHELGHAIGLSHLDDEDAIMYETASDSYLPQFDDYSALFSLYGSTSHTLTLINNGPGHIIVEPLVDGTGVTNIETNILMRSNYDFLDCYADTCELTIQDGLRLSISAVADDSFVSWTGTTIDSSTVLLAAITSDRTLTANYTSQDIPGAPTSLVATVSENSEQIALTWGTVGGATSYDVYRCTSVSISSCGNSITGTEFPYYSDPNSTPGTTYYYRVKACSGESCSDFSSYSIVTISIPVTIPIPASQLEIAVSNTAVTISWEAVDGASMYNVYRCALENPFSCDSLITNISSTSYSDAEGDVATSYHYRVVACNSVGCSDYSNSIVGMKSIHIPSRPGFAESDTRVLIAWVNTYSAETINVYRCTSEALSSCGSALTESAGTYYTDTEGTAGTTYYYRLKACHGVVCSEFSDFGLGTRSIAITLPDSPSAPEIGVSDNGVSISWVGVDLESTYEVYRCETEDTSICGSPLISTDENSYDDIEGEVGVTYYYRLKVCNSDGCSEFSSYSQGARLIPITIPSSPNSLAINESTSAVSISWGSVDGADSYEVYRCQSETIESCSLFPLSTSNSSLTDTEGLAGIEYYYRVKACNTAGCSSFSEYSVGAKIGFMHAIFSSNQLTIPAVLVDSVFGNFYYTVVLELSSSLPNYDFSIVSSIEIGDFQSGEYSTFTAITNILNIPKAEIGDSMYSISFQLLQEEGSTVFRVIDATEL